MAANNYEEFYAISLHFVSTIKMSAFYVSFMLFIHDDYQVVKQ